MHIILRFLLERTSKHTNIVFYVNLNTIIIGQRNNGILYVIYMDGDDDDYKEIEEAYHHNNNWQSHCLHVNCH